MEISVIFSIRFIIPLDIYYKFIINGKYQILMVSSEISRSEIYICKYFFFYKNKFACEKMKFIRIYLKFFLFKLLSTYRDFINSGDCIENISLKSMGNNVI